MPISVRNIIIYKSTLWGRRHAGKENVMKRFTVFAVIALVLVFALALGGCGKKDGDSKSPATPSTPSVNMQEGQWEITTQANMPGMPAAANKSFTFTTCINKKDMIPQQKEQVKSDCKMEDRKVSGDTISMKMVCPDMTSTATYTYAGNTFEGKSEAKMKIEGKEMVMNSTMKGKYLGPCPPGQQQPQPQPAQPEKK